MIKLDYSLSTPEERNKLVEEILAETPDPSDKYLEILADYLVLCMEKQEKKERSLLTENRMVTVNKRETSFEGLVSQLENGEDGIYNLITENKNIRYFSLNKGAFYIYEDNYKFEVCFVNIKKVKIDKFFRGSNVEIMKTITKEKMIEFLKEV